jgi:hypothetical protein
VQVSYSQASTSARFFSSVKVVVSVTSARTWSKMGSRTLSNMRIQKLVVKADPWNCRVSKRTWKSTSACHFNQWDDPAVPTHLPFLYASISLCFKTALPALSLFPFFCGARDCYSLSRGPGVLLALLEPGSATHIPGAREYYSLSRGPGVLLSFSGPGSATRFSGPWSPTRYFGARDCYTHFRGPGVLLFAKPSQTSELLKLIRSQRSFPNEMHGVAGASSTVVCPTALPRKC